MFSYSVIIGSITLSDNPRCICETTAFLNTSFALVAESVLVWQQSSNFIHYRHRPCFFVTVASIPSKVTYQSGYFTSRAYQRTILHTRRHLCHSVSFTFFCFVTSSMLSISFQTLDNARSWDTPIDVSESSTPTSLARHASFLYSGRTYRSFV
jgi:hypothetical protein